MNTRGWFSWTGVTFLMAAASVSPALPEPAAATVAVPVGAILFESDRPGGPYAVDAGGGRLRDLGLQGGREAHWSPNGRWLAFARRSAPDSYDLYRVRANGTGLRRVIRVANSDYHTAGQFSWSPDSRRLAFVGGFVGGTGYAQTSIWSVRVDGRGARRLTSEQPQRRVNQPSWSPDGRRIAYVRQGFNGVPDELRVVDANGGGTRILASAQSGGLSGRPSWSPDGKRLAYAVGGEIFVATLAGVAPRRIARVGAAPAWSPNGRWIAFRIYPEGTFLIRPDGTGRRRVSTRGSPDAPSWSPDSRALAIRDSVAPDVWVVAADGRTERRLTQGWRYGYGHSNPEWQPAGLKTATLAGAYVSPANPSDSLADGTLLKTTQLIRRLSADGSKVAVLFGRDSDFDMPDRVEAWEPASGITRFHQVPVPGLSSFVLSGERVLFTRSVKGKVDEFWSIFGAAMSEPRWTFIVDTCCNRPREHLESDGPLAVVDEWGPCRLMSAEPCTRSPRFAGKLFRIGESGVEEIVSDPGGLTLLSVNGNRMVVDRENGALTVFRLDGTPTRSVTYGPATMKAAKLAGDDLVALTSAGLTHYDATSGALRHHRSVDANARLHDADGGLAVYSVGRAIHVQRLADERELVIVPDGGGSVLAQLEPSGLFYSYRVPDAAYPGRIAFVPFAELLARVEAAG